MRVLVASYPHVGIGRGGMHRQIVQTIDALERKGVRAIPHTFLRTSLDDIQLCHVFGVSVSNHDLVRACHSRGIPVVISTVFNSFGGSRAKRLLSKVAYRRLPGFLPELKSFRSLGGAVSRYVVLNEEEGLLLREFFGVEAAKISIVPNGVDRSMVASSSPKKDERLVLCVGEVCERKNQLALIDASRGQTWKLIIVGKATSTYARQCIEAAGKMDNVSMLGELAYGSDQLRALYRRASVFCLPSHSEVQPLALIEAAGHDCRLVVSRTYPVQTYLDDVVIKVDPDRPASIASGITQCLKTTPGTRARVLQQPDWDDIGSVLIQLYEQAVKSG